MGLGIFAWRGDCVGSCGVVTELGVYGVRG